MILPWSESRDEGRSIVCSSLGCSRALVLCRCGERACDVLGYQARGLGSDGAKVSVEGERVEWKKSVEGRTTAQRDEV